MGETDGYLHLLGERIPIKNLDFVHRDRMAMQGIADKIEPLEDFYQTPEDRSEQNVKHKGFKDWDGSLTINIDRDQDHYANFPIQPTEYIMANGLGWCEGNVIKYVTRHHKKGGRQDIEKAIDYLETLLEEQYGE